MEPERRLIPAHELRGGSRVFVEPQHADIPRAAKLDPITKGGQWMQVTDYLHGLVARGAALAWSGEPAVPAVAVTPPAQTMDGSADEEMEGTDDAS